MFREKKRINDTKMLSTISNVFKYIISNILL